MESYYSTGSRTKKEINRSTNLYWSGSVTVEEAAYVRTQVHANVLKINVIIQSSFPSIALTFSIVPALLPFCSPTNCETDR